MTSAPKSFSYSLPVLQDKAFYLKYNLLINPYRALIAFGNCGGEFL